MFDSVVVLFTYAAYFGLLFFLAVTVERRARQPGKQGIGESPLVYTLSLAVYCTAWTYYGSVGSAATSGPLFLTIYLGPTIAICLWWTVVRRMVHAKQAGRITSIADFLSARYGKSQRVAALASILALVGTVPYMSLQLKSIITTFDILTIPSSPVSHAIHDFVGVILVCMIIIFTIIFGVRRIDPTERHQGMIAVVAVESVVKLTAMLAVGAFVTFSMHDGFGDIFQKANEAGLYNSLASPGGAGYITWTSYLILAMSAIVFLPRQFHVTVVENVSEKHLLTAKWLFPLYLLLINIFVLPIAMSGLLAGMSPATADTFVLALPLKAGKPLLALLVFLGGVSAAMSMIMITSMTMAVMTSNHLVLPVVDFIPPLRFLRRHMLFVRWAIVTLFILASYLFYIFIGQSYMLVNIGIFSFAAVLQFAPAGIGGIFWRGANRVGALLGMGSGLFIWFYTLIVPSFVKSGWIDSSLITAGPLGLSWLRPESLFGVTGLDPISHCVFWSMLFNIGLYAAGSILGQPASTEEVKRFLGTEVSPRHIQVGDSCSLIQVEPKLNAYRLLLTKYFALQAVEEMIEAAVADVGLVERNEISLLHLTELHRRMEQGLAGAIGSAAAHKAVEGADIFSEGETAELSTVYGEMLAEMKLSPEELKERIDYYQERETMLTGHAHELEDRIKERDKEIGIRKRIEDALRQARRKYRDIFENVLEGLFQATPEGLIRSQNAALIELTGYETPQIFRNEANSFPARLLVEPEAWEDFIFQVSQLGSVTRYEVRVKKRDGLEIWVHLSGRLVYDQVLDKTYVDGSMQDVTAQKEAREKIFQLNEELEQRVKERTADLEAAMRELEAFSYSVSHDLRTPLRAIDGFSQVLVEDYADVLDEEAQSYLNRVRLATQRMGVIIDDILHLSRVSRSEMERSEVDLTTMVGELLDELQEAYPDHEVSTIVTKDGSVVADASLLRIMLQNLLSNAWKFSSKTERPVIEFGVAEIDERREFFVRDNGAGFNMEYVDKLFGAFNRLHRPNEFEGTGVGLAIVHRVVRRHGGYVRAESRVGEGATFYFSLET